MDHEPIPHVRLASLLTTDFTSVERNAVLEDPNAGALARFLASASDEETMQERMMTAENVQLGEEVGELLEEAHITNSFKEFIVDSVREAHATESKVPDEVAPARLGLGMPESIFDTETAPQLEAGFLREHFFNIVQRHLIQLGEGGAYAARNIQAFDEATRTIYSWAQDFTATHGYDPFEGMDPGSFLQGATQAVTVDVDSEEGHALGNMLGNIRPKEDPGKYN